MTTNTVRYFDSSMAGAPTLNGVAGARIALIDALIAGFNSHNSGVSISVSSGIATLTKTSHGFTMLGNSGTGLVQVGPVINISGATPAGLNGDKRILSVPSADTLTFDAAGVSDGSATGTITVRYASLPMTKEHAGTNKAIYSFDGVGGTGLLFRIDDADARYPAIRGAESATDVDTYTNEIPRVASVANYTGLIGSSTADSTARAWKVISDGYITYFLFHWMSSSTVRGTIYLAGDFVSRMSGVDAYNFAVLGHENASPTNYATSKEGFNSTDTTVQGMYIARDYSQVGSPISCGFDGGRGSTLWGAGGLAFPGNINSYVSFHYPVNIVTGGEYRGHLPGIVQPMSSVAGVSADKDIHVASYGNVSLNVMLCATHTSSTTADALIGFIIDEDWR